jgi:hypothetical protein
MPALRCGARGQNVGSFEFVYDVWRRGNALHGSLVELLLKPSP